MQAIAPTPLQGIEKYRAFLGVRYPTMLDAFTAFQAIGGRTIVELGTTRSYVSGGFPGCMVNDRRFWRPDDPGRWDWGAGFFTRVCGEHFLAERPNFHSVDISPEAIEISRVTTADLGDWIKYHFTSSEQFLSSFSEPIDLLYMDAGETGQEADQLHLREAQLVVQRQLLSPQGIILIDDVNLPGTTASKGRLSIPFLCSQGFGVRSSGYQVVLQRPAAGSGSPSVVVRVS